VGTHKDLIVWKDGLIVVEMIYTIARKLPPEEKYGLSSQLRRAAVSIPTNIAEGAARQSRKEYIQYCYISFASLSEIETLLIIAQKIYKIDVSTIQKFNDEYGRKLKAFIKYLKSTTRKD